MTVKIFSTRNLAAVFAIFLLTCFTSISHAGTATVTNIWSPGQTPTEVPNIPSPPNTQQASFTGYTGGGPYNYALLPFTVDATGVYTATSTTTNVVNTTWFLNGLFSPSAVAPSTPLGNFIAGVLGSTGRTGDFTGVPLTAGQQYSVLVAFNIGGSSGDISTFTISGPGCIAIGSYTCTIAPPPPPIPNNIALPGIAGIGSQLTVLDLTSGKGPSMTTCLLATIKQIFGADATYVGQASNGAAQISVGGQTISYYPLEASTGTGLGVGAFLRGDNVLTVGTSCGTFNVVPAVANMADLGKALNASGLAVQVNAKGVFTATVDGKLYVVRPDYFVTQVAATGTPSLAFDADGVLRFTDSAGKVQILRPAFLDTDSLQSAMSTALGGVLSIQVDGSGVFTRINGSQLVLTPEMVLSPAPNGLGSTKWVNDRADHYQYLVAAYYQGVMATAR